MTDFFDIIIPFLGGVFCGIVFFAAITGILDSSHLEKLGEKMCSEHKLSFDSYEINDQGVPIIYCKNETKIEDGYLKLKNK